MLNGFSVYNVSILLDDELPAADESGKFKMICKEISYSNANK